MQKMNQSLLAKFDESAAQSSRRRNSFSSRTSSRDMEGLKLPTISVKPPTLTVNVTKAQTRNSGDVIRQMADL